MTNQYKMRPYQVEAVEAVERAVSGGIRRPVLAMATGLGKTVVFAELLRRRGGPSLVLAHRDELVRQAAEKIRHIWPEGEIGIVKAEEDEFEKPVVVASVQSLTEKRLRRWSPDRFATVVVDEAHHAVAPSYRRILDYLAPEIRMGVTATPFRGDKITLEGVFDRVVYSYGIKDGIKAGWLSDIRSFRMKTGINLDSVSTRAGDFSQGELSQAVNTPERNREIVESWRRKSGGKRALVFAASVDHANALAEAFESEGVPAGVVEGTMGMDVRREVLSDFVSGKILVLANYGVLTEGFDCPSIETVILARPTKSLVLFTQMVGRGTRPSPETGKDSLTLIDLVDQTRRHKLITVADLVGVPLEGGESVVETIEALEREERIRKDAGLSLVRTLRPDLSFDEIDVLAEGLGTLTARPSTDWRDVLAEIEDVSGEEWVKWCEKQPYSYGGKSATEKQVGLLSGYEWPRSEAEKLSTMKAGWAIDRHVVLMDSWAKDRRSVFSGLLGSEVAWLAGNPWEFHSATEKQVKFLESMGYPVSVLTEKGLTKGEASLLIDAACAAKKKSPVGVGT